MAAKPSDAPQSAADTQPKAQSLEGAKTTEDVSSAPAGLESSASVEEKILGRVSKGASTDDQLKGHQTALREVFGDNPSQQPPAPALDPAQAPEARGIVQKDFATVLAPTLETQGVFTTEGLFKNPAPSSEQTQSQQAKSTPTETKASSTAEDSSSATLPSSVYAPSSTEQPSPSTSEKIKAGRTTFSIPNFENDSSSNVNATDDDMLSPMSKRHPEV